jgi:nitrite reductase/ring-hydroxylating ferredoxin subunit/uncharacterized membrane protein
MAVVEQEPVVSRLIHQSIERQQGWLDPLADRLQALLGQAMGQPDRPTRRIKDYLNGTWLGHPLHPVFTDVTIGAWSTALLLDVAGVRRGADASVLVGILSSLPTALSGLADWHDQYDQPRRVGMAHALLNTIGLSFFIASLFARRANKRSLGIGLSTAGLTIASGGAYLGGELVYTLGIGVNRNAWMPRVEGFQVAANVQDLVDGQLAKGEVTVDGARIPLVLLKRGDEVLALGGVCSHLGGPLAEGRLVDERCVECPWHGSRFDMADGSVKQGPAAFPQPVYEARIRGGTVEVRQTG